MLERNKRWSRLDLQMLAMIDFALAYLEQEMQLTMKEKVLMAGFSMSGQFTARFALMHPEIVEAAAYGGISITHMLPYSKHQKTNLFYPVGVSDFKKIIGREFNRDAYMKVPLFYFEGAQDPQDISQYGGLFPQQLQKWLYSTMGRNMDIRWDSYVTALKDSGLNIYCYRYPYLGHKLEVLDVISFLRNPQAYIEEKTTM